MRFSLFKSNKSRTKKRVLQPESLERRELFAGVDFSLSQGVLTITGTPGRDEITVYDSGSNFRFRDGFSSTAPSRYFPKSSISSIRFFGGEGDDRFVHDTRSSIHAALPRTELYGGGGNDRLFGSTKADVIRGGPGRDSLFGFEANDAIFAGDGNDYVYGGTGNDLLFGGRGSDRIYGENGNDILCGDADNDDLRGGNHNDRLYGGGQSGDRFRPGHGSDAVSRSGCAVTAITGDWDGNGTDDLGVYFGAERAFVLIGASQPYFQFGPANSKPLVGNWDGRGGDEVGVFYGSRGAGYYSFDTGTPGASGERSYQFGFATDTPLVGDWDGDRADEFGVFRTYSSGGPRYFLDEGAYGWTGRTPGERGHQFGLIGDKPIVGDWNGDGIDELGVFRANSPGGSRYYLDEYNPRGGVAYARGWTGHLTSERYGYQFGISGDVPLIGDWDRDGKDEFGVVRTAGNGLLYYYLDVGARGWTGQYRDELGHQFGLRGDVVLVGDWNGDRYSDFGVYRSSNGTFHVDNGSRGFDGRSPGELGL